MADTNRDVRQADVGALGVRLEPAATLTFDAPEPANVASIALSPDGTTLLATGWGKRVIYFDLASGAGRMVHEIGDGDLFEAHAAVWNETRAAVGTFSFLLIFEEDGTLAASIEGTANSVAALDDGFVRADIDRLSFIGADLTEGRSVALPGVHQISRASGSLFVSAPDADATPELIELDPATFLERGRAALPSQELFGGGVAYNAAPRLAELVLFDGRTEVGAFDTTDVTWDFKATSFSGSWAAAIGFNEGVTLFDVPTREHLASAIPSTLSSTGVVLDGQTRLFVATPTGVQVYSIVR